MSNLLAKLMADRKAVPSTSYISSDKSATTITTFLAIYNKCSNQCYVDYMRGAKCLVKYLTLGQQPIDYQLDLYPEQLDPNFVVPSILQNYELLELAKVLVGADIRTSANDIKKYRAEIARVIKVIYLVTVRNISNEHS